MVTARQSRAAIARLTPGTAVAHANPELADWEGTVEPDGRGQWQTMRWGGDVRVRWTAGTDGEGGPLAARPPGWAQAVSLTVRGLCPDCGQPACYVFDGNTDGRAPGWHHGRGKALAPCPPGASRR